MKVKLSLDEVASNKLLIEALINHLNYSIADVNCYEELTTAEKSIFSEELFNKLCD